MARRRRQFRQYLSACVAAYLDYKFMLARPDQFRESQIVASPHARPGAHGSAKASRRGLRAIHRHDEDSLAACRIDGISIAIALQYAILHGDGGQFACSNPQECPPRRSRFIVQDAKGLAATLRGQQTDFGGMEIFLPALRTDHIAEQRLHRCGAASGSVRLPVHPSSLPEDQRGSPQRHRRSLRRALRVQ